MAEDPRRQRARQFQRRHRLIAAALGLTVIATLGIITQEPYSDPFLASTQPPWFLYPLEQNAHRRLAFTSADFFSVALSTDGQTGWAVGSDQIIFKSTDRGETWANVYDGDGPGRLLSMSWVTGSGEKKSTKGCAGTATTCRYVKYGAQER